MTENSTPDKTIMSWSNTMMSNIRSRLDQRADGGESSGAKSDAKADIISEAEIGFIGLTKNIGYKFFGLLAECVSIVLGLALIWFYAINVVLAKDAVDISFLRANAQIWFSQAFNGNDATIGAMNFDWRGVDNAFVIDIKNVSIKDETGAEIDNIDGLSAQFAMGAVIAGTFAPQKLFIDGGVISVVRGDDGRIRLGLGRPEDIGKFGIVLRNETSRGSEKFAVPTALKRLDVTRVTAHVIDRQMPMGLHLSDVELKYNSEVRGDFLARLSAIIPYSDISNTPISKRADFDNAPTNTPAIQSVDGESHDSGRVLIKARILPKTEDIDIEVDIANFNFSKIDSLASPLVDRFPHLADDTGADDTEHDPDTDATNGVLQGLRAINAPLKASGHVTLSKNLGLSAMDMQIAFGAGDIRTSFYEDKLDHLKSYIVYDAKTGRIQTDSLDIQAEKIKLKGRSHVDIGDDGFKDFMSKTLAVNIDLSDVNMDLMPAFSSPIAVQNINVTGRINPAQRRFDIEPAYLNFGRFAVKLSSSGLRSDGPALLDILSGRLDVEGDMDVSDIKTLWPVGFATGARRWVVAAILSGTVNNLSCDFNVSSEHFSGQALTDENLRLGFDVSEGSLRYIRTMTPLTQAAGRGVLSGNSFEFWGQSGAVGSLKVEKGHVAIPRLFPKGGDIIIDIDVSGEVSEMLSLIDQKPFQFVSKYGTLPTDFTGRGAVNLNITRPLLERFDQSRIKYAAKGDFADVTAPFSLGPHRLNQGRVNFSVNENSMSVKGPVKIGPWQTHMNWLETFDQGATPTKYEIHGRLSRADLDRLGIGLRTYIGGDIDVSVLATGRGVNISQASLRADLTPTHLALGSYWTKAENIKGELKGTIKRNASGAMVFEKTSLIAPGLSIEGGLSLASDFRLQELDIESVDIDGLMKGGLRARPNDKAEALNFFVFGDYLDVSSLVGPLFAGSSHNQGLGIPYAVDGMVTRLLLDEAYVLRDAALSVVNDGLGIAQAEFSGETPRGSFSASVIADIDEGGRRIVMNVPDASDASFAFFNLDNISGGAMTLTADFPPTGVEGVIRGKVSVTDFKLVEAPILTQMLSLASLQGLSDVLGGAGLKFDVFEAPFAWQNGNLSVRDARASGPALGMTGNGEVNLGKSVLDLDGVLVPAYTANSILENIPVLGSLLVGKKGEGVFGLNYTVKGSFDKTQIAVNPLSALTPGFLRRIFQPERQNIISETIAQTAVESALTPAPQK